MLTVHEVADRLRLSASTVYRLLASGRLRHVRVGRAIRVPLAAVEEYLASVSRGGPAMQAAPQHAAEPPVA